jgi:hypothetical protein
MTVALHDSDAETAADYPECYGDSYGRHAATPNTLSARMAGFAVPSKHWRVGVARHAAAEEVAA